jgi:hypothetical protein
MHDTVRDDKLRFFVEDGLGMRGPRLIRGPAGPAAFGGDRSFACLIKINSGRGGG